jgi:hypothetical protein
MSIAEICPTKSDDDVETDFCVDADPFSHNDLAVSDKTVSNASGTGTMRCIFIAMKEEGVCGVWIVIGRRDYVVSYLSPYLI